MALLQSWPGHYVVCSDLRGKTAPRKGCSRFLDRCVSILRNIGIDPADVPVRVDSGHDASAFRRAAHHGMKYIIRRNLRVADHKNDIAPALDGFCALYGVKDPLIGEDGHEKSSLIRVNDKNNLNFGRDAV